MLARIPSKCDVIMLCETKLKSSFPSGLYNLNGYNRYSCSRESKNCGGGILLYVRKDILILENHKATTTFEKIKLRLKLQDMEIVLLNYYRPPVPQSFKPFIEDVEDEITKYNGNIIIVGDVNLDSNGDNAISAQYLNLLDSYNLKIANNVRTRNASGRIVDHFKLNFLDKTDIKSHTIKNNISDHNIIITQLKGIRSVTRNKTIKI